MLSNVRSGVCGTIFKLRILEREKDEGGRGEGERGLQVLEVSRTSLTAVQGDLGIILGRLKLLSHQNLRLVKALWLLRIRGFARVHLLPRGPLVVTVTFHAWV